MGSRGTAGEDLKQWWYLREARIRLCEVISALMVAERQADKDLSTEATAASARAPDVLIHGGNSASYVTYVKPLIAASSVTPMRTSRATPRIRNDSVDHD